MTLDEARAFGAEWVAAVEETSRPAAREERPHAGVPCCDQIGQTAVVMSHVMPPVQPRLRLHPEDPL